MWQKCPLCEGVGIDPTVGSYSSIPICPICKGQKIISQLTGKPPEKATEVGKKFCFAQTQSPNEPCFYPHCECNESK